MKKLSLFFWGLVFSVPSAFAGNPRDVGNFLMVLHDLKVPVYRNAKNGTAVLTQEALELKQGQIVKVDRVDDKNSWIDLGDSKKSGDITDYAVIPDYTFRNQTSLIGTPSQLPLETLRYFSAQLSHGKPLVVTIYFEDLRQVSNVVYYDSKPGRRVSLTKRPLPENTRCDDAAPGGNPCVGWPSTGDSMIVIDSKAQYILNTLTDRYEPKLFYKVQSRYCPRKDYMCLEDQKKTATGWIAANNVSFTKRPAVPGVLRSDRFGGPDYFEYDEQNNYHPLDKGEREAFAVAGQCTGGNYIKAYDKVLTIVKNELLSNNEENSKSMFNELVSSKLKDLGTNYFGSTRSKKSPFNALIKTFHQTVPKQSRRGSDLTDEEFYAVDALARTIYGEVRGCINEYDHGYAKAIARVIYNRAAYIHSYGNPNDANWVSAANPAQRGDTIPKILVEVVGNDRQFSVYNAGDPNLKHTVCPDRYSPQWRASVSVAYQVVKRTSEFLKETENIYQTRYYSHMASPPWKDGKPKTKFIVNKTTYGVNAAGDILTPAEACVTLFSDKKDREVEDILPSI